LAALSRYRWAWKMAYFSTEPASERWNPTGKNRVRDIFRLSNKPRPANRRQPAQPRRKIRPTPMKPVSGIPYWPSRDPIEDSLNLYGFGNNAGSGYDVLGKFWVDGSLPDIRLKYMTTVTDGNGGLMPYPGDGMSELDKKCCVDCMKEHEGSHIKDMLKQNPNIGKTRMGNNLPPNLVILWTDEAENCDSEIKAYNVELECLKNAKKTIENNAVIQGQAENKSQGKGKTPKQQKPKMSADDTTCLRQINGRIVFMGTQINYYTDRKIKAEKAVREWSKKMEEWHSSKNPDAMSPGPSPDLNPIGLRPGARSINGYPNQ